MLEWLVIGGGVHGTLLSRALVEEAAVAADRVRVLDPHDEPLERFRQCAAATGLEHLRSSVVHHLDRDPMSLVRFAERERRTGELEGIYRRPSLALFVAHCEAVAGRTALRALRVRGAATAIERSRRRPGLLRIETGAGAIEARRVVLALGSSEQPVWPTWAQRLRAAGAPVCHVFEPGFRLEQAASWRRPIVVGGGLSAAQLALWLAARRPGEVTMLSRHETRIHEFDADSRWMGPRGARGFARIAGGVERRRVIRRERHRGSIPADFARALTRGARTGELRALRDEVAAAAPGEAGGVELELASGSRLRSGGVLLATGFEERRPGGSWLDRTIEELGLECAACGYPVVDAGLRWSPGLYVSGPLAELEIGPVARNILGARLAGRRLVTVARG